MMWEYFILICHPLANDFLLCLLKFYLKMYDLVFVVKWCFTGYVKQASNRYGWQTSLKASFFSLLCVLFLAFLYPSLLLPPAPPISQSLRDWPSLSRALRLHSLPFLTLELSGSYRYTLLHLGLYILWTSAQDCHKPGRALPSECIEQKDGGARVQWMPLGHLPSM